MRVRLGRGKVLGEVEEYFVSMLTPGDTFLFAGRLLAFEGIRSNEVIVTLAKTGARPEGAGLCRRQAAADHPSGRPRAPPAGRPIDLAPAAAAGRRVAGGAGAALAAHRRRRAPGRDLRPRCPALSGRLLLRRPQRAPDPGHAADPAHGAARPAAAWASWPRTTASPPGAPSRSRTWTSCSTSTSWATISRSGWPRAR